MNQAICDSCQNQLQYPDEIAGKKVRCPKCKNVVSLPVRVNPKTSLASQNRTAPTPRQQKKQNSKRPSQDLSKHNLSKHNPIQAQPIQAQPIQAQPIQAQPIQAQPIQAQPIQAQPIQAQPIQAQPIQAQPIQAQPIQAQPIQAQPIKHNHSPAAGSTSGRPVDRISTAAGNWFTDVSFPARLATAHPAERKLESSENRAPVGRCRRWGCSADYSTAGFQTMGNVRWSQSGV